MLRPPAGDYNPLSPAPSNTFGPLTLSTVQMSCVVPVDLSTHKLLSHHPSYEGLDDPRAITNTSRWPIGLLAIACSVAVVLFVDSNRPWSQPADLSFYLTSQIQRPFSVGVSNAGYSRSRFAGQGPPQVSSRNDVPQSTIPTVSTEEYEQSADKHDAVVMSESHAPEQPPQESSASAVAEYSAATSSSTQKYVVCRALQFCAQNRRPVVVVGAWVDNWRDVFTCDSLLVVTIVANEYVWVR